MPDEDLKKFARDLPKHMPDLGEEVYAFKHMKDIIEDQKLESAEALPPPPGPPPPLENVQGALNFNEYDAVLSRIERITEKAKNEEEMSKMVTKTVPEMLMEAAAVYKQRQDIYGYNYLAFGKVMMALFPDGLTVSDIDTWNRLGIFVQMMSKTTRYASQFKEGGHDDSLLDLSVYSQMLREVDSMGKK